MKDPLQNASDEKWPDERPYRSEYWLRLHYEEKGMSQRGMARKAGVGRPTITRWMDKFGIETRDRGGDWR